MKSMHKRLFAERDLNDPFAMTDPTNPKNAKKLSLEEIKNQDRFVGDLEDELFMFKLKNVELANY